MTWFRVHDKFHSHVKPARAGLAPIGAWTLAGSWCGDHLTDGRIPREVAHRFAPKGIWEKLIAAGMATATEEGYELHDYLDWNMAAEEVLAERARKVEAGKKGGLAKAANKHAAKQQASTCYSDATGGSAPLPVPHIHIHPSGGSAAPEAPAPSPTKPRARKSGGQQELAGIPAAKPKSVESIAWGLWREEHQNAFGRAYSDAPEDGKIMRSIAQNAVKTCDEQGHPDDAEALLRHRFGAYFADPGRDNFLANEGHPLRCFVRDIPKYGAPWDPPSGRPPSRNGRQIITEPEEGSTERALAEFYRKAGANGAA